MKRRRKPSSREIPKVRRLLISCIECVRRHFLIPCLSVLERLESKSDPGASYDSSAREDVAKCLPGTRELVLDRIQVWLNDPQNPRRLLWINGPAGCGKTSIAQSISEILARIDCLAASFFWSRSGTGRPTTNEQFVATICFQLCKSIPGLIDHVASALEHDPGLFNLSISKQMDQLVVQPLNHVFQADKALSVACGTYLLLTDGLDECTNPKSQKDVINILVECLASLSFPLQVLVSSRDEHVIRTTISQFSSITETLALADSSEYYVGKDIRTLFQSRFYQIQSEHPAGSCLLQWPTPGHINTLVHRSAGLFIYADVVMKYIESSDYDPRKRLEEIIDFLPQINHHHAGPYSDLASMYALILKKVPLANVQQVQEIFELLIYNSKCLHPNLVLCDVLFDYELFPGTTAILLKNLASVIRIPLAGSGSSLGFYHKSFSDFLENKLHLQHYNLEAFHCSKHTGHANLVKRWLIFFPKHIHKPQPTKESHFETSSIDSMDSYEMEKSIIAHQSHTQRRQWSLLAVLSSICDHYNALLEDQMVFSNTDLVYHLQNFNLAACLKFGEYGSIAWWQETLKPALIFFGWLISLKTVSVLLNLMYLILITIFCSQLMTLIFL